MTTAPMRSTRTSRPDAATTTRGELDHLRDEGRFPGIQYAVTSAAGVTFEYSGGLADIAAGRVMDADTTLMAYSMSKTITAVAVLQLIGSGHLELDSPIAGYLPNQPYGPAVTVRQLLAHTGGIPNPLPLRWAHATATHSAFNERAALARILTRHGKLARRPNRRFRYSNIGYWMLGAIVEEVTGQSFPDYVRERVFAPLELPASEIGYVVPDAARQAKGYLERRSLLNLLKPWLLDPAMIGPVEGSWVNIRDHYVDGTAVGGIVGTARAFARFLRDQLEPQSRLLSPQTKQLLYQQQQLSNGTEVPMTLGWHTGQLLAHAHFYKEGGGGGFHCLMRVYPAAGIGTVVMTNATTFDVHGLLDRLDRGFLR